MKLVYSLLLSFIMLTSIMIIPAHASLIKNVEMDNTKLNYGDSFQYSIVRTQIGVGGGEQVKTRIINLAEGTASDWSIVTLDSGRHTIINGTVSGAPFDKKGDYTVQLKYRENDKTGFTAYRDFQLLDDVPIAERSHLLSPYEQRYVGFELADVKCHDGLQLVKKSTLLLPACVRPDSISKLIERGWLKTELSINSTESPIISNQIIIPKGIADQMQQVTMIPQIATIILDKDNIVVWINQDDTPSTLVADDGSWTTGLINPGESASVMFNHSGTFDYHGEPHPWQKGTVIVK